MVFPHLPFHDHSPSLPPSVTTLFLLENLYKSPYDWRRGLSDRSDGPPSSLITTGQVPISHQIGRAHV